MSLLSHDLWTIVEPVDDVVTAEKVVTEDAINLGKDYSNHSTTDEIPTAEHKTPKDEFCSNESFESASDEQLVEKILITADCQADWSDRVVTKLMNEKLNMIGITMKSITVNRNARKCFESCLVIIKPVHRK